MEYQLYPCQCCNRKYLTIKGWMKHVEEKHPGQSLTPPPTITRYRPGYTRSVPSIKAAR